jgi:uncharacterized DUF497 family protein
MKNISFEWDLKKAAINLSKHRVSFDEAKSVFYDDMGRIISDPDHSEDEQRYILIGLSRAARLLVVCHCYRMYDKMIRIISARKATNYESDFYP